MKLAILALLATSLFGQCTHVLTRTPVSGATILVYRNGLLLQENLDYTLAKTKVSLIFYLTTDTFQYVYDRVINYTDPNTKLTYGIFSLMREYSTCATDSPNLVAPASAPHAGLNWDQTQHDKFSMSANGPKGTAPGGFVTIETRGQPRQVWLDSAYVMYRSEAPPAPGPCMVEGTGVLGVDQGAVGADGNPAPQYVYLCVPDTQNQGFVWARLVGQVQLSW